MWCLELAKTILKSKMLEQDIADMQHAEVLAQLDLIGQKRLDAHFVEAWVNRVIDYCYDRVVCKALGVDYSRVDTEQNISKVKLYAYHKEFEYYQNRH